MPESSASDGRPLASAKALALRTAFSSNVSPVSSTSKTMPASLGVTTAKGVSASSETSSFTLPALLVARRILGLFMPAGDRAYTPESSFSGSGTYAPLRAALDNMARRWNACCAAGTLAAWPPHVLSGAAWSARP